MKPYRDIWWAAILREACGVMAFLALSRRDTIEMVTGRYGKPWRMLQREGWRVMRLDVREIAFAKSKRRHNPCTPPPSNNMLSVSGERKETDAKH